VLSSFGERECSASSWPIGSAHVLLDVKRFPRRTARCQEAWKFPLFSFLALIIL
jgi:hypothetical protein